MTSAASEGLGEARELERAPAERGANQAGAVAEKAAEPGADEPEPLVESASDAHETVMTYDPNAHVPVVVIAVWAAALLGLGAYMAVNGIPDLLSWLR